VNELGLPDLYEAAARATINERCAPAYLHDIRGSMQALFSALELLGRSAKSGSVNPERVERACELARRAISHHEKSTLETLQILTLQHVDAAAVDVLSLAGEVVHFLRNDAANKDVVLKVAGTQGVGISAERARLQTVLVGLLTAAIDEIPPGASLLLSIGRVGDNAVISVDSDVGYQEISEKEDLWNCPPGRLRPKELTLLFARQFLAANGGRLEIDAATTPRGAMHLYYPVAARNDAGASADAALALP
jgi:hypothetical protein